MNKNADYLEKRLLLLRRLCRDAAKNHDDAVAAYLGDAAALDAENAPFAEQIPFPALIQNFGLNPFEANVLFLSIAPAVDAGFRQILTALRQNFALSQVDVATALDLFSENFAAKIENRKSFSPGAPLFLHHICELIPKIGSETQLQDMVIQPTPRIVSHVLNQEADADIGGFSRIMRPTVKIADVVISDKKRQQILSLVENCERCMALKKSWGFEEIGGGGRNIILLFSGPSGTGKTLMAQAVAGELKRPLLLVDAHELQARRGLEDNLDKIMREARLQRAVLLFDDCELIFAARTQGNRDLPLLLAALDAYEGIVIMTTNLPAELDAALDRRVTMQIDFDILPAKLRESLWIRHIPKQVEIAPDVDLPHLAEKYEFSGGMIRNSVSVAMNRALASAKNNICNCGESIGNNSPKSEMLNNNHVDAAGCAKDNSSDIGPHPIIRLDMQTLDAAARTQIRNKIKKLADKTLTALTIDDLVLPKKIKEKIRSLIASVRNRRTIFEDWGFGEKITKGRGICALFRGDSGTGKTLSAEIIANELGMALYRVRIPAIVSKYVGETEKNLEKCFREAAACGAVLLFDEADSIFSKRTEVKDSNDRYANMEVNLLLQEVERFEGVVILTTNLDAAIDDAFERRLNHKIDFPFPDARDRARIWKRLLPAAAPLAGDIDFETLGRDFELSGGCIKNSVLRAAYKAAERKTQIDMQLLEDSGLQEYREMGKLVPNRRNPWD